VITYTTFQTAKKVDRGVTQYRGSE